MVTPKFLALVFPVRIGAAQQSHLMALCRESRTRYRWETRKVHTNPRGVMVAAMDSKSIPARGAGSIPAGGTKSGSARLCKNVPTGESGTGLPGERTHLTRKPAAVAVPDF